MRLIDWCLLCYHLVLQLLLHGSPSAQHQVLPPGWASFPGGIRAEVSCQVPAYKCTAKKPCLGSFPGPQAACPDLADAGCPATLPS